MVKDDERASLFIDQLCQRTQELRQATGMSQAEMADLLGIPPGRYQKYEVRSPIPHHIIPRFAALCGVDIAFVLTGRSQSPPPRRTGAAIISTTKPRIVA